MDDQVLMDTTEGTHEDEQELIVVHLKKDYKPNVILK